MINNISGKILLALLFNFLFVSFILNCSEPAVEQLQELYICSQHGCGRRFRTHERLHEHILRHWLKKSHACGHDGCGKRFKTPYDLMIHAASHSNDKPFFCHCGTEFKRKSALHKHNRIIHGLIRAPRQAKSATTAPADIMLKTTSPLAPSQASGWASYWSSVAKPSCEYTCYEDVEDILSLPRISDRFTSEDFVWEDDKPMCEVAVTSEGGEQDLRTSNSNPVSIPDLELDLGSDSSSNLSREGEISEIIEVVSQDDIQRKRWASLGTCRIVLGPNAARDMDVQFDRSCGHMSTLSSYGWMGGWTGSPFDAIRKYTCDSCEFSCSSMHAIKLHKRECHNE